MNESKNPSLSWYEFTCGNYKVGIWAKNKLQAKKEVSKNYKIVPESRKYGKDIKCTIVI